MSPLDWVRFCVENICHVVGVSCEGSKDKTVAFLTSIGEDHGRDVKGACSKSRARELLNLECSINYDYGASSRCGKGKAQAF